MTYYLIVAALSAVVGTYLPSPHELVRKYKAAKAAAKATE
jgi:hypothetical protein